MEVSFSHSVICSYVLQDIPCKFLIKSPSNEDHSNGGKRDDDGNCNEVGLKIGPQSFRCETRLQRIVGAQNAERLLNLVILNRGVDEEGKIGDADADDLNSILHSQCIPYNDQIVQETENEEGQKCRNGFVLRLDSREANMLAKTRLKFAKDKTGCWVSLVN